jgi:neutral amino acid transport system permease protein
VEAGTLARTEPSAFERLSRAVRASPGRTALVIIALVALWLILDYGLQAWGQRTVNGLVSGSYFALGAVGLTLVYGILRLVNFAHGDMLTFGVYIAFLVSVTLGAPFAIGVLAGVVATAALGVTFERVLFRPMRDARARMLQLLLVTIGLAFVLRNAIQFVAGPDVKRLDVNVTSTIEFLGLRIGTTELVVMLIGFAVLALIALMLRYTTLGKQMRALSDNFELAETTGIDTDRIVIATWIFAGGLAGLAGGMLGAATGVITPNIGFFILLSLFASVILGGIGNAYGALAGGLILGLSQEWSTLLIDARWKTAVGFAILIIVLIFRPQGVFGRERTL